MDKDTIIRLAREAGLIATERYGDIEGYTRFAALVAAHERKQWQRLTDEEIKAIANPLDDSAIPMTGRMWIFVGDLQDKLEEKNT